MYPDSRNRWAHTELLDEGYEPHTVSRMWVMGLEPNLFVDITDVFDLKVQALLAHRTQVGEGEAMAKLLRNWATANAAQAGWNDGRLAEAFREVDTL